MVGNRRVVLDHFPFAKRAVTRSGKHGLGAVRSEVLTAAVRCKKRYLPCGAPLVRCRTQEVDDTNFEGKSCRSLLVASRDLDAYPISGVEVIASERGCKTPSAPVPVNPYKRQPLSSSSCPSCMMSTAHVSAQSFHKMLADAVGIWLKHRIVACCCSRCKTNIRQNHHASATGTRTV